jgi:alkylation response protein AidB-like acyl-CoA dehydrogenase
VHFAFTEQQNEFREAVRQVLAKECTTDHLRAAHGSPAARTPRWATLADLGVVGLSVPVAHGGLGLGLVDLVPLLEEAGRVGLPEPLLETTALAAPVLVGLAGLGGSIRSAPGADAATSLRLESIAAGGMAAAVGAPGPVSAPLAGADGADLFVLPAPGADGPEVHVLESGAVAVSPVSSLDPTRRLGLARWEPTPESRVATGALAASIIGQTADRAAVATAAELLGLADRMIGMAADYARERHQFGKPIGSFQAVKHLLAGAQVKLEFARPAVYGAAWALDQTDPAVAAAAPVAAVTAVAAVAASRAASTAKAYASDAATEAARVSLQVHGAIGYTWECDLHLFLKRAWALSEAWGSAADHRSRVLSSLIGPS